jgi:succinate dehydrogenase / fumarate reductase cytochrome b subunit
MTTTSLPKSRPLSPHLGIYKPQISSVMSILHRISGVGLAIGLLFFVAWLLMLAGGQESYNYFIANIHILLGYCTATAAIFLILLYVLKAIVKGAFKPQGLAKGFACFLGSIMAVGLTGLAIYYAHGRFANALYAPLWYVGQAVLIGWTWAFFYHFCCGIRHLCWDAGWFLSLKGMHVTGWITLLISTVLTVLPWLKIWGYIK